MPYIPFFSSFCQPDVFLAIVHLQDTQFKLEAGGMKVACLHGELSKMQRQQILAQFIDGRFRALVHAADGWVHSWHVRHQIVACCPLMILILRVCCC